MTTVAVPRKSAAEKHDERRRALAESALITLGELGYARSSLREIANNSEFSHGVVHYYFRDKRDLLVYCVQYYKQTCVHRYDEVVAESRTPDELTSRFAAKLVGTIIEEAPMHRLWYDLRSQSMFEESLQESVGQIDLSLQNMIWRVVSKYAELRDAPPVVTPPVAYAMLDGLFQQALLGHLAGRAGVLEELEGLVPGLMPMLLSPSPQPSPPS